VGEIVVKKSKRGKAFYGCSQYPNCDAVYWSKPVTEPCPKCKASFLLEKTTKKQGTFRYCANEECGYSSNEAATAVVKRSEKSVDRPAAR
jgi:DNA topoisomerase-1